MMHTKPGSTRYQIFVTDVSVVLLEAGARTRTFVKLAPIIMVVVIVPAGLFLGLIMAVAIYIRCARELLFLMQKPALPA